MAVKVKGKIVDKNERYKIRKMFLDGIEAKDIALIVNRTVVTINSVLFDREDSLTNGNSRIGSRFGKRTAYWEKEIHIEQSLKPVYLESDLEGWEKTRLGLAKGEIKTIEVMAGF